ncbi:MAG: hypothetical protein ORN21_04555 [Methylophilaceae bacterium]|nr:hypothetical protein [Methylophilaceae bacterium]
MKCKASATQEASHINEIGEPPTSAPPSHSPVQTILPRSLALILPLFVLSLRHPWILWKYFIKDAQP